MRVARNFVTKLVTRNLYLETMFITINGERKEFPQLATVAELLSHLKFDARKIAVERNMQLVKRTEYEATPLNDGDEIEIVNFVGGG